MAGDGEVQRWAQAMRAAGRSERTITERVRIITATGLDPATCSTFDLEAWLARQEHLSLSSRRAYQDALRACFAWLHARGLRADNPTVGLLPVRVPRGRPRPISEEQLRILLGRARRRRLRGYLLLGAFEGLRVSEIAAVAGADVDLGAGTLRVCGKGGRVAVLPLHPEVATFAVDMPPLSWWFPAYCGRGHVTGNNVSKVIGDHMRRCGVDASAHQLRHFFASSLVAHGAQTRVLQELMRHANLQNTQVYSEVTPEQMRATIRLLPEVA